MEFHVDAELVGEHTAGANTIIHGGWYPVEDFGDAKNIAVRNLMFDSPFDGALLLYGANTELTGNRAAHTVGSFRTPQQTYAEVFVVGFSGRVRIEDNVIEDVAAELGIGVSQFRAAGPVVIRGNTISDTGYGTIESSFNVSSVTGAPATVSITDNHLRPGPAPDAFGVGIEINGEGSYYIARNDILVESPNGLGVYALGAPDFGIAPMIAPVIEKNDVTLHLRTDLGPVFADGTTSWARFPMPTSGRTPSGAWFLRARSVRRERRQRPGVRTPTSAIRSRTSTRPSPMSFSTRQRTTRCSRASAAKSSISGRTTTLPEPAPRATLRLASKCAMRRVDATTRWRRRSISCASMARHGSRSFCSPARRSAYQAAMFAQASATGTGESLRARFTSFRVERDKALGGCTAGKMQRIGEIDPALEHADRQIRDSGVLDRDGRQPKQGEKARAIAAVGRP